MLHRTRASLHPTADRGHQHVIRARSLAEFGVVAPVGRNGVEDLLYAVADQKDERIPESRACVSRSPGRGVARQAQSFRSWEFDRQINAWHRWERRRAAGLTSCPVSVRDLQPRWSPALPIRRHSDRAATLRPGSVWFRGSKTGVAAERSSAASPSREIVICAACSPQAPWRSFAFQNPWHGGSPWLAELTRAQGRRKSQR